MNLMGLKVGTPFGIGEIIAVSTSERPIIAPNGRECVEVRILAGPRKGRVEPYYADGPMIKRALSGRYKDEPRRSQA